MLFHTHSLSSGSSIMIFINALYSALDYHFCSCSSDDSLSRFCTNILSHLLSKFCMCFDSVCQVTESKTVLSCFAVCEKPLYFAVSSYLEIGSRVSRHVFAPARFLESLIAARKPRSFIQHCLVFN